MKRNPEILVQIQTVDALLAKSGVRDYCMSCIKDPKRGGCCENCPNLGPDGCKEKPLACALWLCREAKKEFPETTQKLYDIQIKYPFGLSQGYRHISLEYEAYYGAR